MTCIKYVQKHFSQKIFCALQVSLCALISRPVCARTRAQLRGNIDCNSRQGNLKLLADFGSLDL